MGQQILIVGVGLIGASFALALKRAGVSGRVIGMDREPRHLLRAQQLGIIDHIASDWADAMEQTDLVLLATPVAQIGPILHALAPYLHPDIIVTDTGSTKAEVVHAARSALGEKCVQFVPGHPIAGRELNGPEAGLADLYVGKKVVLTPYPENPQALVDKVEHLWQACGAHVHYLSPEQHDQIFAVVSHLPHLLAYALVDDIAHKPHADLLFQYAASGFRDFTRIAGSNAEMWRDISLANQSALLTELDAYLAQLQRLREHLAAGDGPALQCVYANAQRARHSWQQMIEHGEQQAKEGGD